MDAATSPIAGLPLAPELPAQQPLPQASTAQVPPDQVPPPGQTTATAPGWWRRNWWGLLAVVPLFALAVAPAAKEGYDLYNRVKAHEAVNPGSDGWVSYSDARIRLTELAPTTEVKTYGGEPFQPPEGTRIWRATITFEVSDNEAVSGCSLELEDTEGRMFSDDPDELEGARVPFPGCTPDEDNAPSPYQIQTFFVLPTSATPAAVHITRPTLIPKYARLPTP
jgi:hypothetical protein